MKNQEKTRTEYAAVNVIAGFGGYFLNTVLGYICRMIFARYLPGEYLGINGLFSNILAMLSLAELGIGSAIGFALYKPIANKQEEKIASLMKFYGKAYRTIGCVVAILGIIMLPFLHSIIGETPKIKESITLIYLVYLFNTVNTYFFSYRAALISASQRHYIVLSVNYIVTIIQSCIQIPVLILTKEYLPYLFIQTVGTLINNIVLSIWAKKDYPYIDKKNVSPLSHEEKRSLFVNIKALTVNRLCASLVNNTDNIVITYFNGLITTGLTSNYSLLVNTLGTLAGQFFNSITASVGNLNASESKEKRRSFFDVLNLLNFWIYGWGAIGIAFVSGEIVRICFGEGYVLDLKIPIVIALNFYLVGMNNAVWAYKNTMGLFRYGQYLLLVTAGINLWLDIVLGKQFGLLGIYMATIIARLLTNVWYDPYAVFKYGLETDVLQYYKKFIKYAFVLGIAGGLSYKFTMMCNFPGVLNVLTTFFICTVIPNSIFVLAFARTDEFRYLRRILFNLSSKVQKRICHK